MIEQRQWIEQLKEVGIELLTRITFCDEFVLIYSCNGLRLIALRF